MHHRTVLLVVLGIQQRMEFKQSRHSWFSLGNVALGDGRGRHVLHHGYEAPDRRDAPATVLVSVDDSAILHAERRRVYATLHAERRRVYRQTRWKTSALRSPNPSSRTACATRSTALCFPYSPSKPLPATPWGNFRRRLAELVGPHPQPDLGILSEPPPKVWSNKKYANHSLHNLRTPPKASLQKGLKFC